MHKKTLRQDMKAKLAGMSGAEYDAYSLEIQQRLLKDSSIKKASLIGLTISAFPEVNTMPLIEKLWAQGKRVAVPKCEPKTRAMIFYEITSFDQLETVYMQLKEPIPTLTKAVSKEEIECLIVPGVVFDELGYRIGFGGGYYDRYLANYNGICITLAFALQLVHKVPTDKFDLPVHKIITETAVIDCHRNRKESYAVDENSI
ncbi:5-formyltetrahydrofolate cyclo-ligase [Viridibacillus sp. YIM B01967]|uniref:5-formyltetrahydrofolate cyclo-ligase n=1 Tax=Viridibacillus soli TaxID=2798301 RepID=A0ABS1H3L5_9BACL|nr:5-formyltetrahydrofolate cyclo-ligase [Viridibacillus soli]MBK3493993.1 5-formyltetrahydrofolate cyclo-ligase [Viridibacillus soli]